MELVVKKVVEDASLVRHVESRRFIRARAWHRVAFKRLYGSDLRWRYIGLYFTPVRDFELYPSVECDARVMRAKMGAFAYSVLLRFANFSVIS